ncbi:uncharacterized protein PpBr36_10132, partial [Pyricularia pennisetigena]|uniref:uncharacterized protein n=1 Tax=Pyricularia pennisetigena TaxID=1578925 RepID=UPI00114F47C8
AATPRYTATLRAPAGLSSSSSPCDILSALGRCPACCCRRFHGSETCGLQVVPQHHDGLQTVNDDGIEVDHSTATQPWDHPSDKNGKFLVQDHGENATGAPTAPPPTPKQNTICGLRKQTFYVLVGVLGFVVIAAAVGGGVGGSIAARNASQSQEQQQPSAPTPAPTNRPKTSPVLQESALAGLNWRDASNETHYRVYFQSRDGAVMESARNSAGNQWTVSRITDPGADIKSGTPLAASAGFPHVNTTWDVVKNVYFSGSAGIMERQNPFKEARGVWGNDNLSGQYTSSNRSLIVAFWDQNYNNRSQNLILLYQTLGANSLSVSKYFSDRTSDLPWATQQLSLSILDGSPLALARIGNPTTRSDTRLYLADSNENLMQCQFDFQTGSLGRLSSTAFKLQAQTPLAVIPRDNTGFYNRDTLPECARTAPYTHLILFASSDRSSLLLVSWNCSGGFVDQTSKIGPLVVVPGRPSRTYLALAAPQPDGLANSTPSSGRVFVLFDAGDGPQVEEWQAPRGGTDAAWEVIGPVPVE